MFGKKIIAQSEVKKAGQKFYDAYGNVCVATRIWVDSMGNVSYIESQIIKPVATPKQHDLNWHNGTTR